MSRSHSSSRTGRSNSEQRLSYDEVKEMMLAAAQDMKRREERDKEKAQAAAAAAAGGASVLTESKVVNSLNGNGSNNKSCSSKLLGEDIASAPATAAAAKVSKFDRKSVSCRETRSMQTKVDRLVAHEGGRTAIAWNSRPPQIATEKWRNGHGDAVRTVEEPESRAGYPEELEEEVEVSGGGPGHGGQQPPDSSISSSSDPAGRTERAPHSCRTKKPSFDFTALDAQASTFVGDKVRMAENLSRTQAWLDEAEDLRSPREAPASSLSHASLAIGKPYMYSPEIKEEEELEEEEVPEMMTFERSALIEDQLPGRLSQSVRFIKPGNPFILPSKQEKKMSTSSLRAFSAKIAKKLGRLFFSGSKPSAGAGPSKSGPVTVGSIVTATTTATSESSTTESPKLTRKNSRASSFRKWLQKPASAAGHGSKVASAAEPDVSVKPVQQQEEDKNSKQLPKAQPQGKENVEVRNADKSSPAPPPAAFHHSLSKPTTDSSSTKHRPAPFSSQEHAFLSLNLWSRPERATTTLPGNQRISPQEYARSVLGWEHSPEMQPLRLTRRSSFAKQPPSPSFSGTAAHHGQSPTIPSLVKSERDEDGTLVVLPDHSTRLPPEVSEPWRKEDLHSGGASEDVAVLNLTDYAVFSSDEGSLSPGSDMPATSPTSSSKSGAEMGPSGHGLQVELIVSDQGPSSCADHEEESSPCWSPVSQSDDQEDSCLPWCMEASQSILPETQGPFAECSKYAGTPLERDQGSPLFDLSFLLHKEEDEEFNPRASRNENGRCSSDLGQGVSNHIGSHNVDERAHVPPRDGTSPSLPPGWEPLGLTAVSFYTPNPGKIDVPSSSICEDGESLHAKSFFRN